MGKIKKILLLILGIMLLSLSACEDNGNDKGKVESESNNEKSYNGVSGITTLADNNTWKYTKDHIDCELYGWDEDVVLPIPKPEGSTGIEYEANGFYLLGINQEEWEDYVEVISEMYTVDVVYSSWTDENDSCYIRAIDMNNNFMANLVWNKEVCYYNMRNAATAWVYVGSREKHTSLTNEEVLNMALEKIAVDDGTGFGIVNISSDSNLKDGFDVYYLSTSNEYTKASENNTYMYLCVVKDEEIVFMEPNCVELGTNSSLEFMENENQWKMYLGATAYLGDDSYQTLRTYNLEKENFVLEQEDTVYNINGFENIWYIVLEKEESTIGIYQVNRNDNFFSDGKIPDYKEWVLGDKVGVIDGDGIKALEYSKNDTTTENVINEDDISNEETISDISFRFEENTLYVSGIGTVTYEDRCKWDVYISDIEKIIIEDGVTMIGASAFREIPWLEEVIFADSVEVIGAEAFVCCYELQSVKFSRNLKTIEFQAFCYCDLLSLEIPDSVTEIGWEAFAYSVNLDNYQIPKGIIIEEDAFYRTKMLDDMVAENQLAIVDGVLYDGKMAQGDVVIPDGVEMIAAGAFYCSDIESVEIPASVEYIGDGAFERCAKMKSVKCLAVPKEMGMSVFSDCISLETVELAEGIKNITFGMFSGCVALKDINIPKSVEVIETQAFNGCSSLEELDLSGSLISISNDVFFGCGGLKTIKLSENFNEVGIMTFGMCDSLEVIYGIEGSYAEKLALKLDCEFIAE